MSGALVTRSSVPAGRKYNEYLQELRDDFFYSCAYCTMTEAEAQAIRFVIDHYEPRNLRPDLVHVYANLMYSCEQCNQRKGDLVPPPKAREAGYRFFKADEDVRGDHFDQKDIYLEPKTKVGEFSIKALDLNRLTLLRIRSLRKRLVECDRFVTEGIEALRRHHIDRLNRPSKARASHAIFGTISTAKDLTDAIDAALRRFAKSELIDPDAESDSRLKDRAERLKQLEGLYAGRWRAPRKRK